MSKRYYKPQPPSPIFPEETNTLPTDRPVAIYYRQSTDAQIGNISTAIQTTDMKEHLMKQGWSEENIKMIDMDAGISGTTRIDERPGMSQLYDLILAGEIGAVACQDEDRLFRDVTQIQVNIFIEACKENNVYVLTPNMVYNFGDKMTGSFHTRQFRFKSEMAADYIHTVINGKLLRAKRREMMEGRWTGFIVLPGYMVDTRRTLPDGSNNPNWKKYVPFPEYAEVVVEYFHLFLSYAGNVHATVKHIHRYGPFYPDPKECSPPEGFKFVTRMRNYGRGYCPARNGLVNLLTNATLIGHWAVNGVIEQWDNHEPIVDEELFFKAFNYLSSIALDGRENPNYRPFSKNARPTLEKHRPVDRPLCADVIEGQYNGKTKRVGTIWEKHRNRYIYALQARHPKETIIWRRTAKYVDDAVTKLLHEKLRATFSSDVWATTLAEAHEEYEKERNRIRNQLKTLEMVKSNMIRNMDTLTNREMIQKLQVRYEDAQAEENRLNKELAATLSQAERIAALEKLKDDCEPTLDSWEHMTRDEKCVILHTFVNRIEATPKDGTGMHIKVHWVDNTSDEVTIAKRSENGQRSWLDSETEQLKQLVEAGASQVDIAGAFPKLTWNRIYYKICKIYGYKSQHFSPRPIRNSETYMDYKKRLETDKDKRYEAYSGDHWLDDDINVLLEMFDSGASKLEILKAFPHRRWQSMAKKIRSIRGDVELPQDTRILWKDMYADFLNKSGDPEITQAEQSGISSQGWSQSTRDRMDVRRICAPS